MSEAALGALGVLEAEGMRRSSGRAEVQSLIAAREAQDATEAANQSTEAVIALAKKLDRDLGRVEQNVKDSSTEDANAVIRGLDGLGDLLIKQHEDQNKVLGQILTQVGQILMRVEQIEKELGGIKR